MTPPLRIAAKSALVPSIMALLAMGMTATDARAQVDLASDAIVLSGSASNCTRPATVNWKKVRNATDEWKKIQDEGLRKDSPKYRILHGKMLKKIKAASRAAASSGGYDLVVRSGDISNDRGLPVSDITQDVIRNL